MFYVFRLIIFVLPTLLFTETNRYKIYDCFTFFNELEVLEIKLNELYDHIDYFVLVESTETFMGKPKPLYFEENKEKFSKFLDKIIHIVITDHIETQNPWEREYYQKNQALKGLIQCEDDDIIIISDTDEILRAAKLPDVIAPLLSNQASCVSCELACYTYYLNRQGVWGANWSGWMPSLVCCVVAKYGEVKRNLLQGMRSKRAEVGVVRDAGWHFSYMGGIDRVKLKFGSFSHCDYDIDYYRSTASIRKDIEALKLVEIDEALPQFVRDHIPYFKELGLIDMGTEM